MILIIEPDKKVRKKLSDLLSRERIIGKGMLTEALEILCRYKQDINLIIADVQVLMQDDERQIINQICKKLSFEQPPMLGIYVTNGAIIPKEVEGLGKKHRLIGYREGAADFPANYLRAVSDLYPRVCADLDYASKAWMSDKADDMEDLREWLETEGYVVGATVSQKPSGKPSGINAPGDPAVEDNKPGPVAPGAAPAGVTGQTLDYEKMYHELKQKYDELLVLVHELTRSIVEDGEKETGEIQGKPGGQSP